MIQIDSVPISLDHHESLNRNYIFEHIVLDNMAMFQRLKALSFRFVRSSTCKTKAYVNLVCRHRHRYEEQEGQKEESD